MEQTTGVQVDKNIRQVYECVSELYSGRDNFSHISSQLMSSTSDLAKALKNLQSGPNKRRYMGLGQAALYYGHYNNRLALSVRGDIRFALERIFDDGVSVDFVTYIGEEDYFHRAAFVHSNGYGIRIVKDTLGQPQNPDKYLNKFLRVVRNKREKILKAANDPNLPDEKSQPRKDLEAILDSVNPST